MFALKTILVLISMSTIFALLIYFFGEPFQSIRLWILNNPDAYIQTRGARLAGFTTSIFIFSYQLTTAAVLSYGVFMGEKKLKWLLLFSIVFLGVILNGERSSALMAVMCIAAMTFFHYRKKFVPLIIILIACSLTIGGAKFFLSSQSNTSTHHKNLLQRLGEKREGEFRGRILQGAAGLVTVIKNPISGGTNAQYQKEVHKFFNKYAGAKIPLSIEIPASHNHYINIAQHAGITGLMLFFLFCRQLLKLTRKFRDNCNFSPLLKNYYIATVYALIAVLGNALFHNHGIFFAETTSWALVGLIGAGSMLQLQQGEKNASPAS